jgi:hypothetical protein
MAEPSSGRRRIDRVTAPDVLDRAATLAIDEVRSLRDDCREEELRLSYARRLLQARLDIARAELARRAGEPGAESLVASLPSILADAPGGQHRDARSIPLYSPQEEAGRRMVDGLVDDASLGRLPDLSDEELRRLIERLTDAERGISETRAAVLGNLDGLQAELVSRYRSGTVSVDSIVEAAARRVTGGGEQT